MGSSRPGSELALACGMRFAAAKTAIFGQIKAGVGADADAARARTAALFAQGLQTRSPLELDIAQVDR